MRNSKFYSRRLTASKAVQLLVVCDLIAEFSRLPLRTASEQATGAERLGLHRRAAVLCRDGCVWVTAATAALIARLGFPQHFLQFGDFFLLFINFLRLNLLLGSVLFLFSNLLLQSCFLFIQLAELLFL